MRYGSVCSGIEAATAAWHPLGWKPAFFSEIEAFPRAVLQHHYPDVPLHGDFTTITEHDYDPIDLLVGGTPCQSFSIAGLRKGITDERGNLTLEFVRLAQRLRPRWLVWENVPGVLSSGRGRDFGSFLGALAELGYGFAYRVLDAQYFGVPQRRRRVFVVGYLGDWRPAAAVLFERESLLRDITPRRETRKDVAPTISARTKGGGGLGTDFDYDGGLIASPGYPDLAIPILEAGKRTGVSTTDCRAGLGIGSHDDPMFTLQAGAQHAVVFAQNTRDEVRLIGGDGSVVGALAAEPGMKQQSYVAFDLRGREGGAMPEGLHDTANIRAASGGSSRSYVAEPMAVRRLTPRECERLQGFEDDFTLIPLPRKGAFMSTGHSADGPRYKALGNSMAVPVMRHIGERIQYVEDLITTAA